MANRRIKIRWESTPVASRICGLHLRSSTASRIWRSRPEKNGPSMKTSRVGTGPIRPPRVNARLTGSPCRHPYPLSFSRPAAEGSRTLGIDGAGGRVRGRPKQFSYWKRVVRARAGMMAPLLVNQPRQDRSGSVCRKCPVESVRNSPCSVRSVVSDPCLLETYRSQGHPLSLSVRCVSRQEAPGAGCMRMH
jgi:hypothetical protein